MSRTLRVGALEALRLASAGGHGRTWTNVLDRLGAMAGVELVFAPEAGESTSRSVDVWLADGHAPLEGTGRPLVVQIHEVGWRDPVQRSMLSPYFVAHIERLTAQAVAAAERVITPSEAARLDVVEAYGVPPERVHAVAHGVDADSFHGEGPAGRAMVAAACRGGDAPYVLFVGLLHPRKNLGVLREAMGRLIRRGLPHRLVVVGEITFAARRPERLEQEAELPDAQDRVAHMASPSDAELSDLMAGADALCLPSHYEGFGLPVLEAMACGTPVVVSNRGALPEVVGDAGLVVEPTPEAVEDALSRVLTDSALAARLAGEGARRAATFTWDRAAEGWRSVLTLAAGSKGANILPRP